ncbi:MAG: CaiB/BaiF CoA transferase family protein [Acidimicrobiales bacterium]
MTTWAVDGAAAAPRGPLSGLSVVEFAGIGPAPFCAMVLSDLGADVVRIDRPADAAPDPGGLATITDGILTRGRRSIAIDLKHPDGVATALDLVGAADVCIEGFRPGVMERLGLGPDVCLGRNPRLTYGRLTGWGQEGPYASRAGHDLNYIAIAGALAPIGRRGARPVPPLNLVGDFAGGSMLLAMGLLAGVLHARATGEGQVVDAAMVDGSAYLMTMMYELLGRGAWVEERESNPNDGGAHFYDVYETADGKYLSVAAMEPRFFDTLLARIGVDPADIPPQWDSEGWPAAKEHLAAVFRSRTRDDWCDLLEGSDTCVAPVLTMGEALTDAHNVARQTFIDVGGVRQPAPAPRFSKTPAARPAASASPGAHTEEILAERGLSAESIAALRAAGAVA